MDKTTLALEVGASEKLVPTVAPENATDKSVNFVSSDTKIATVTPKEGTVKAVATGTATITVGAGGKSATCTVTVTAPEGGA